MEREKTQEREAAAALAEALGNLPLALEQAAAYATQAGLSLADYLELFRARRPEVEARLTGAEEYPPALAATFDIAFTRLQTESPAAAELLTLCAFLPPDKVSLEIFEISLEILKGGAKHLPPTLGVAASDPEALSALGTTLQNYALAKVRGGSFLTFHHFVQAAAIDRLSYVDRKDWVMIAMRLVEDAYGPNHPEVAIYLSNLGRTLQVMGDLVGARVYLERALAINEAVYGFTHPAVSVGLNNLAHVLVHMGDLAGAQANRERALAIAQAVYGPNHPDVAIHLNNLGLILKDQGDLEGARAYLERALRIFQEVLGEEHPSTLLAKRNLQGVLEKGEGEKGA